MSMINIALTGLNSNKAALDATAQNVANVNTKGYSRQQAVFASVGAGRYDRYSAGSGVEVTNIRRVSDAYMTKQSWLTTTQSSFFQRKAENFNQLEQILAADGFSISKGMDKMYAALNDATVKPESIPLRQQIINESEALANRFNSLSNALYTQQKDLSDQRTAAVNQANSLLKNIAAVDQQIVAVKGFSGSQSQLLDQRDELIEQLSGLVNIRTTPQQDGSMQITLQSGQPLMIGSEVGELVATPRVADPLLVDFHIDFSGQKFEVTGSVGASIGATSEYQQETLKPYQQSLNDMARVYADEVNRLLAGGKDLKGLSGKPLFDYDPVHPASSLKSLSLKADELALSSDGTAGNSDVLKQIIEVNNKKFPISGLGNVTVNDAFSSMVGKTAISARQAKADSEATGALHKQALAAKQNLSSVNRDEEASNLMTFANAYQANMQVISTANRMFDAVLQLF